MDLHWRGVHTTSFAVLAAPTEPLTKGGADTPTGVSAPPFAGGDMKRIYGSKRDSEEWLFSNKKEKRILGARRVLYPHQQNKGVCERLAVQRKPAEMAGFLVADEARFELAEGVALTRFRGVLLRPLGHSSSVVKQLVHYATGYEQVKSSECRSA